MAVGKHAVPSDCFVTNGASLCEIGLSEMSLGERRLTGLSLVGCGHRHSGLLTRFLALDSTGNSGVAAKPHPHPEPSSALEGTGQPSTPPGPSTSKRSCFNLAVTPSTHSIKSSLYDGLQGSAVSTPSTVSPSSPSTHTYCSGQRTLLAGYSLLDSTPSLQTHPSKPPSDSASSRKPSLPLPCP